MFGKYFAITFAILLVFSGTVRSTRTELTAAERDIKDEAEKLIQKLKDLIENQINAAKEKIQKILDQIEELASNAIESTKNKIMEEYNKLLAEIEKIKDEIGSTVSPCIDEQEEKIKNLPNEAIQKLISCVTDKINEAKDIINSVVQDIQKIPDIVNKIETDLKSCGSLDIVCYGKVVTEATKAIASIPTDIAVQLAKASELVATIEAALTACATKQVTEIALEAAKILADITKCAITK